MSFFDFFVFLVLVVPLVLEVILVFMVICRSSFVPVFPRFSYLSCSQSSSFSCNSRSFSLFLCRSCHCSSVLRYPHVVLVIPLFFSSLSSFSSFLSFSLYTYYSFFGLSFHFCHSRVCLWFSCPSRLSSSYGSTLSFILLALRDLISFSTFSCSIRHFHVLSLSHDLQRYRDVSSFSLRCLCSLFILRRFSRPRFVLVFIFLLDIRYFRPCHYFRLRVVSRPFGSLSARFSYLLCYSHHSRVVLVVFVSFFDFFVFLVLVVPLVLEVILVFEVICLSSFISVLPRFSYLSYSQSSSFSCHSRSFSLFLCRSCHSIVLLVLFIILLFFVIFALHVLFVLRAVVSFSSFSSLFS